jgi:membrane-anchored glycerophosphoryl diester phosphodiesterase (GDPDase)
MTNGAGPDIFEDFKVGLELLKRYPVMVAPPLIAMVIAVVLLLVFGGGVGAMMVVGGMTAGGPGMAGAVVGSILFGLVFFALAMLINLICHAVVVVMARDALAGREPSMGDAFGAVIARLGDVVVASVLFAVLVGVASLFLVVPGLIVGFFLMFTLPAVVLDQFGAVEALKRSFNLVKDNLGACLGLVIGAVVAAVIMAIVSGILRHVPVIGQLASALLAGAFVAYLTIVGVRVYQALPRR